MTVTPRRIRTEIAHILFLDIVGYSLLPMEEQTYLTEELNRIVRATPEFSHAEEEGELICLGSGDGMALVFLRDPVAPAQCAVEIAQSLQDHPQLKVRMGINSGPISRVHDITNKENVSGDGINMAQRVMDCGEAGHILLSHNSADFLRQYKDWAAHIHPIGEAEVKYGLRLALFTLCVGKTGNREVPSKLHAALPHRQPIAEVVQITPRPNQCVMLLYKHNVQPDEEVRQLLEMELRAHGYEVFVDRNLSVGVEWAREIERQLRSADAVIPLLSKSAIRSEMLEYELQTAHKAAQAQQGRPRILPVRIHYTGRLPGGIAALLDPLHYVLWQGTQDDRRLVDEILKTLQKPFFPSSSLTMLRETVGGAVPLDSAFYLPRPVDAEFKAAIARQDSIVLVKGARQMGKTSLLARGLQQAREAGAAVILTDFQTLNDAHLKSADTFYLALATAIVEQLNLAASPRKSWDTDLGASLNMEWFLRREVLSTLSRPVVWGLDEVDRLFMCDFGSEVFGLIRSWHNRRALEPGGPWSRLTLALAYATEAHLFINDLNQSPFNVGTRVTLEDFTLDQVAELNRRYGEPLQNNDELTQFYRLVSGHPYLVRRGLCEMVTHAVPFSTFQTRADRDEGPFGDHLRRIFVSLTRDVELSDVVRGMLQGKPCPTLESFYRLWSAGLVTGDSAPDARPRCQVYATYLARHLL